MRVRWDGVMLLSMQRDVIPTLSADVPAAAPENCGHIRRGMRRETVAHAFEENLLVVPSPLPAFRLIY